jgi:hypothetical protein
MNEFKISESQPLTESGDMLDTLVHQNIRLSDVIVSDILYSDHLPIVVHIVDHVKIRKHSEPVEKFRLGAVSKPLL